MSLRWQILLATFVFFFHQPTSPKIHKQTDTTCMRNHFYSIYPFHTHFFMPNQTKTQTHTTLFFSRTRTAITIAIAFASIPMTCHNKMFCFMFGHIPFYEFIFLVFLPFGISTSNRKGKPHKNACGCFIEKLPNCNRSPTTNRKNREEQQEIISIVCACSTAVCIRIIQRPPYKNFNGYYSSELKVWMHANIPFHFSGRHTAKTAIKRSHHTQNQASSFGRVCTVYEVWIYVSVAFTLYNCKVCTTKIWKAFWSN